MLISSSVKGHALFCLLPFPCCLSYCCFAFKAPLVKLNDTSFIPVPMIECPYFIRRSFLSTLLMIERKVHGSKSPPSFFLTVKRKLARNGSNSFRGINECSSLFFSTGKLFQPSPHHAVSFSLCSCFVGHLWTVLTYLSNFRQILEELHFHQMLDKVFHLENYLLMEIL